MQCLLLLMSCMVHAAYARTTFFEEAELQFGKELLQTIDENLQRLKTGLEEEQRIHADMLTKLQDFHDPTDMCRRVLNWKEDIASNLKNIQATIQVDLNDTKNSCMESFNRLTSQQESTVAELTALEGMLNGLPQMVTTEAPEVLPTAQVSAFAKHTVDNIQKLRPPLGQQS